MCMCSSTRKQSLAHALFTYRGTPDNGGRRDLEEKNYRIKSLFLFSLRTKSILVALYNYG